jgi:hypothetical protein
LKLILQTNKLIIACIFFTVVTMVDLLGSNIIGGEVYTAYWHLGSRLILCTLAAYSLVIFSHLKKLHTVARYAMHFAICIFIMVAYTWINGFFLELHPRAYFYAIRTMLMVYPLIGGGLIAFGFISKAITKNKLTRR